jgi:hypothetical protein
MIKLTTMQAYHCKRQTKLFSQGQLQSRKYNYRSPVWILMSCTGHWSHQIHGTIHPHIAPICCITVLPHKQQIKILFYTTPINVIPDYGPVRSKTCRRLVFLKILSWIKLQLCAFAGWNCGIWYSYWLKAV